MAFWNPTTIQSLNTGVSPNDGTGDDIRDAFIKVGYNVGNISSYLSSVHLDFLNANVQSQFNSTGYSNIANLTVANIVGTIASFSSNVTAGNLISTTGSYNLGTTINSGNTYVGNITISGNPTFNSDIHAGAHILPTANVTYDLGSPTQFFRTLYVQTQVSSTQVAATSDAGLLQIHANVVPGDIKDVGVFGKYNESSSNSFAFFGYQHTTNNFVYKNTKTDATAGNSVVYDGVYGNVQFGSLFLSNSTVSSSTSTGGLIVAGGVGVAGNINATRVITSTANITSASFGNISGQLYVDGNIYSTGYQVITTNTPGINLNNGVTAFTNGVTITAANPSVSPSTGALILSYGGLGVAGNINASGNVVASGFVGTLYGNVNGSTFTTQNLSSGAGVIGNLTVSGTTTTNQVQATTVNSTTATIGTLNLTTLSGLTQLSVSGNITGTSFVGPVYGNQNNITGVGTLGSLTVSGNTAVNNTFYGRGIYDNSVRVVSTSSGAGNLTISSGAINLTAAGPGVTTVGSTTSIPVITTDAYGRIATLTTASISTTLNTSGTSGTGSIALASQTLNIQGGTGISTSAVSQTVTITNTGVTSAVASTGISVSGATGAVTITNTGVTGLTGTANQITVSAATGSVTLSLPQSIATASTPTFGGLTIPSITKSGTSGTGDIGSSGNTFGTIYGKATTAQYADLAEKYLADQEYPVGTVVAVGGDKEVTASSFGDLAIGVVSDKPAYMMNSELEGGTYIALKGRVPVMVVGSIHKGQRLVATNNGCAVAGVPASNNVFAVALENSDDINVKLIEAVIL